MGTIIESLVKSPRTLHAVRVRITILQILLIAGGIIEIIKVVVRP